MRQRIPRGTLPEVATYVIETDTLRIEMQEVQPIGPESLKMSVGDHVVFALDKKTAYVRDAKETEHRLLVTKKITKPSRKTEPLSKEHPLEEHQERRGSRSRSLHSLNHGRSVDKRAAQRVSAALTAPVIASMSA